MAKKKDFFAKLKEQAKINNPDFDSFLEKLTDEDIPDPIIQLIESKFMTAERAVSDRDVYGKVKAEVLDAADTKLNELTDVHLKSYLDPIQYQDLKRESTYKRMDMLNKLIPDIIKKVKTGTVTDEDTKKQIKELQKTIEELGQEKVAMSEKVVKDVESVNDQWSKKLEQTEINYHLDKLSNKFTLAEAFEQDRDAVNNLVLGKVKAHNLRLIDQNGQKVIMVNDEHGKPKFNGSNSAVTIQSLLEEGYKPYLKKSETPPRNQVPPRTTTIEPTKNPNRREGARNSV